MINTLLEFWHSIPFIIRLPVEFVFFVIILRGIIANDITSWLEDKGLIKHKEQSLIYRMLDFVYFTVKRHIPHLERHSAIWHHYRTGHEKAPLDCGQERCKVFLA